jgi:hypothetical protein
MDPEGASWDVNSYLLANLIDLEQWLLYQGGQGKGAKPKAFYRPPAPGSKRRTHDQRVAEWKARHCNREGE